MEHSLLPLGSVVRVDGRENPVMIIGYAPKIKDVNDNFDYLGVNYPFGLSRRLCSLAFDSKDILRIDYVA